MADLAELACQKSIFGGVYYFENITPKCYYQTAYILGHRYILPFNIGLLLIIALLSILVRKIYAWILLNQTLLHLLYHLYYFEYTKNLIIKILPDEEKFSEIVRNTILLSPYASMLGLAVSRYIAFYFPNFYDKHVTNKKIFPIILLWDILCFIPVWIWQYIYLYTDFRECPHFSKNVCDTVNSYYKSPINSFGPRKYYPKEFFDLEKMKNDSIKFDECFEFKACFFGRLPPFNDNISKFLSTGLTIFTLIFSIFLFARIISHLKNQSKINKNSLKTSLKIILILLFQSIYFLIDNIFSIAESFFEKDVTSLIGARAFVELFYGAYTAFYYFYITFDCLLIMFLLTDYRFYLLYFIPKHSSSTQVSVISSSLTNSRI